MDSPRIAILGFASESNRFAPVSTRQDFVSRTFLAGETLLSKARSAAPAMTPGIPAFVRAMERVGAWIPGLIPLANAASGGPVEHGFLADTCEQFRAGLEAAAAAVV